MRNIFGSFSLSLFVSLLAISNMTACVRLVGAVDDENDGASGSGEEYGGDQHNDADGEDGRENGDVDGGDEETIAACGNGLLDPGEDCDDGNDVLGDGCSLCRVSGTVNWRVTPPGVRDIRSVMTSQIVEDGEYEESGAPFVQPPPDLVLLGRTYVEEEDASGWMARMNGDGEITCELSFDASELNPPIHEEWMGDAVVQTTEMAQLWGGMILVGGTVSDGFNSIGAFWLIKQSCELIGSVTIPELRVVRDVAFVENRLVFLGDAADESGAIRSELRTYDLEMNLLWSERAPGPTIVRPYYRHDGAATSESGDLKVFGSSLHKEEDGENSWQSYRTWVKSVDVESGERFWEIEFGDKGSWIEPRDMIALSGGESILQVQESIVDASGGRPMGWGESRSIRISGLGELEEDSQNVLKGYERMKTNAMGTERYFGAEFSPHFPSAVVVGIAQRSYGPWETVYSLLDSGGTDSSIRVVPASPQTEFDYPLDATFSAELGPAVYVVGGANEEADGNPVVGDEGYGYVMSVVP